jgi:hypothetical protein
MIAEVTRRKALGPDDRNLEGREGIGQSSLQLSSAGDIVAPESGGVTRRVNLVSMFTVWLAKVR